MTDIERALVQLGDEVVFPATPDLAGAVREELPLRLPAVSRRRNAPSRWVLVAVAAAVAAIVLLGLPRSRTAIADLLGLGAVKVTIVDSLPAARAVADPPGVEVPLQEAQGIVGFPLSTLGTSPAEVFVDRSVPGALVTFVYETANGSPSLTLTQVQGTTEDWLIQKMVGPGTDVVVVETPSGSGFWFQGGPHVVIFVDMDGTVREEAAILAGNTLVYVDSGVTHRIEGDITLEEALAIATELSSSVDR